MKSHSHVLGAITVLLSCSLAIPLDVAGQAMQRAGEVSRAIPTVNIARGTEQLHAEVKMIVNWGDVVRTGDAGRARLALDDGSVLNLGASSELTVAQHNPAAQQTQLDLAYGRLRSKVVKQTKPNSKFEVHTAVGVAGVVGTDFFTGYLNGIMQLVVYEGHVRFCNLDVQCVDVLAGQTSTIRDAHQSPSQPSQAAPSELTEAANATSLAEPRGLPPVHHSPHTWAIVGVTLGVMVPAIVVPLATRSTPSQTVTPPCGTPTKGC